MPQMNSTPKDTTYCVVTTQHQCDTDEDGYCLDCDELEDNCCCYENAKIIRAIKKQEEKEKAIDDQNDGSVYPRGSYTRFLLNDDRNYLYGEDEIYLNDE